MSPYRCVDRDHHGRVVVGWVLVETLVWTVPIEVVLVLYVVPFGRAVRCR
jgi:hypothetical protein